MTRSLFLLVLSSTLWLGGCAAPSAQDDPIDAWLSTLPCGATDAQVIDQGLASWYGERFHGRRTASGEPFDMRDLTAAHKTLPFGTRVRVRNVNNGREVVVRINDRGPFSPKRVIDLSHAAASALGMLRSGVVSVQLLRE
ncbi:MAG: septal ring lytic transglycosylase RlpA family lipoprotein [Betaproteobacteria bacterium HGW-Betaproteobacteria-16]|nr:MAG: septal ring lytic transglycosylase RlpA family lipoprotein [Betaproteobacteria bacterium HGW-Betaproteobacteria-16]